MVTRSFPQSVFTSANDEFGISFSFLQRTGSEVLELVHVDSLGLKSGAGILRLRSRTLRPGRPPQLLHQLGYCRNCILRTAHIEPPGLKNPAPSWRRKIERALLPRPQCCAHCMDGSLDVKREI